MRVMVTGATAPVGRALVAALLEAADVDQVLGVGREAPDVAGFEADPRLRYAQVDLCRSRDVRQLVFGDARDLGIDAVVHAASHRSVSDRGPAVHEQNVEATRELLRLSARHPTIGRFVYRSFGEIYRVDAETPSLLGEDSPLDLSPRAPQRLRDRVEADLTVCTHMGMSPLRIAVLRCAEIMAPESGSQLYDYLASRVCFRALGYDPMLDVMTVRDAVRGIVLALRSSAQGVFNLPGKDVLPLSVAVDRWGPLGVAVPGPLLGPLYALRRAVLGTEFRYRANVSRLHFSGVLDGRRARRELGYEPTRGVDWPR